MTGLQLAAWLVVALFTVLAFALARWERREKARRMDEALQRLFFEGAE
jgi:hypothetical protein